MATTDRSPVIPGASRLRKVRFRAPRSNRGRSGSYRVYFANLSEYGTILLMAVLAKSDKADLNQADLHALAQFIHQIEGNLKEGTIK
jgi:hypothetical protein